MSEEQFKACPFCGCDKIIGVPSYTSGSIINAGEVRCHSCGGSATITNWNCRVANNQKKQVPKNIEELETKYKKRLLGKDDWYQQRLNRIRKWVEEIVCPHISANELNQYFAIVANGSATSEESADWSNTIHSLQIKNDYLCKLVSELEDWQAGAIGSATISYPPRIGPHTEEAYCDHKSKYERGSENYRIGADIISAAILYIKDRQVEKK